ncbi:divergent polysaccharide deacetylase family protein [Loktanella sp. DJP18]|uniref:divergent polysaccharide deacetylase family protein n=1 Tax=Loktanella sp. DJP18 TaxID=3409788 RepID=UPI003BB7F6FE
MAFLKGAFWGVVIGGAGVAVVSIVAPQPAGVTPPVPPVIVLQDAPREPGTGPSGAALPQVATVDAPGAAGQVSPMVSPETAPDVPQTDGNSAQPEPMDLALTEPAAPAMGAAPLDERPDAEAPVLPNPQSVPPRMPAAESDIVVDATPDPLVEVETPDPADPVSVIVTTPEPAPVEDERVAAPPMAAIAEADAAATPPDVDPVAPESAAEVAPDAVAVAPSTEQASPAPRDTPATMTAPPIADSAADPPADMATVDPVTDDAPSASPAGEDAPAPVADTTAPDRPDVVAIIDTPSSGLPGGNSGVVVRRPGVDSPAAAPQAEPAPAVDDATPALVRYGAFFDNPEGLPLMSIVLRDDGSMANGARALADIPFPVTVLLDPARPDARERMQAYAAAGIEVAALAKLPTGATATDAAVALEGIFDAVPEAVALVATVNNALPTTADAIGQVISGLATDGRGLLVPDTGLNAGLRAADVAEVHAATIYRDLDDNDQDARVIRRFVDQAAFRARQQPGVVLLGRVRPETISALILWGQANRAGQVALAPLSALLLAQ